jgi:DNA-directed RNA polymerase subunit K/omega
MSKSKKVKVPEESDEESEIESEINELLYEEDDIDEEDDEEEPNDCLIDKMIEDDNDYFENMIDSEIKEEVEETLLELNERISSNRLTKYEMVRILGERTKQLTLGAKPMVKNYQSLSYDKIAEEELKLNMIPYKIKRLLPNHKYEIWTLDELKKDHLLSYLE